MRAVTKKGFVYRLAGRFGLVDSGLPVDVMMEETIQPVTVVDNLLREQFGLSESVDLTGAANVMVPQLVVPEGKRAHIKYTYEGASTGTSYVQVDIGGVIVQLGVTQAAYRFTRYSKEELVLNEGDSIGPTGTTNGADGAITFQMLYDLEDAH